MTKPVNWSQSCVATMDEHPFEQLGRHVFIFWMCMAALALTGWQMAPQTRTIFLMYSTFLSGMMLRICREMMQENEWPCWTYTVGFIAITSTQMTANAICAMCPLITWDRHTVFQKIGKYFVVARWVMLAFIVYKSKANRAFACYEFLGIFAFTRLPIALEDDGKWMFPALWWIYPCEYKGVANRYAQIEEAPCDICKKLCSQVAILEQCGHRCCMSCYQKDMGPDEMPPCAVCQEVFLMATTKCDACRTTFTLEQFPPTAIAQ